MNQQYAIQQKQTSFGGCGEEMMMRRNSGIVCPKPRRVVRFDAVVGDQVGPLRLNLSQQQDWCDTEAANELFDIILAKGAGVGLEKQSVSPVVPIASSNPFFCGSPPASSNPFFCGSPPSRVSNPLIHDTRFGDEKVTPYSPRAIPVPSGLDSSPSSKNRKGGCVREIFGNNPAVRVEGFDCLDRDRRAGRIPTLA